MPSQLVPPPAYPRCPEGSHRVGNNRGSCRKCNAYAARVRTATARRILARHGVEAQEVQETMRREIYELMFGRADD